MKRHHPVVVASLLLYSLVIALPILWLLYTSLKSTQEIFASAWSLPAVPQWDNYVRAWQGDSDEPGLGRYFGNSVVLTLTTVGLILAISGMATHALTRFRYRGRDALFDLFVGGMAFPIFLAVVPLFLLLNQTRIQYIAPGGFINHYGGLVAVYVAFSLPFTIFVLSGFFRELPRELEEAAAMDGATRWQIYRKIVLPLARPGMVVAGIFNVIGIWNEYPLALVLITRTEKYTLPLGLAQLTQRQQYSADWGALFAALVVVMMPTLFIYLLFQRQFSQSITAGAVKG